MATKAATQEAEQAVQRILTEDVLTLTDTRSEIHELTKKRPDKATVCRWCRIGVGPAGAKVKLEHIRLGNQIFTSKQAITRFIQARTASA
ncbi:MAG: DUF1580 domain-containing protein [Rubripirellula sp.]